MATYVRPADVSGSWVLADVTIVDVDTGSTTDHQDVLVTDGRIEAITTSGADHGEREVVDGSGRFVVPGFVDAHAHPLNHPDDVASTYGLMLANGIVAYRQMSGSDALLAARSADELLQPPGAPTVLAMPGAVLTPLNAATPAAASGEARHQAETGADFVKAAFTSPESFFAAAETCREVGLPLAGHLPGQIDAREAAHAGVRCIEHLGPGAPVFAAASCCQSEALANEPAPPKLPSVRLPGVDRLVERAMLSIVVNPSARTTPGAARALELADEGFVLERADELATLYRRHETWQCPTLLRLHTMQMPGAHSDDARLRYVAPGEVLRWRKSLRTFTKLPAATKEVLEAHFEAQLRLTKVFADVGVPMLAGTDSNGAGWVVPGFGLHDEMDLLAAAGLSPLKVLQLLTVEPARFLDRRSAGRVEVGYDADLVLLGRDPVASVEALHDIRGVCREGSFWSRSDLDDILERCAALPTAR